MAHEVLQTWEFEGRYHVIPSVCKQKGQSLASFSSESRANMWARARSATTPYTQKARKKIRSYKGKKRMKTILTGN